MSLPARLSPGAHILHVSETLLARVSLAEYLFANIVQTDRRMVAVVEPELVTLFEKTAALAGVRSRLFTLRTLSDLVGEDGDWSLAVSAITELVDEAEHSITGWRLDEPESETLVFVDLNSIFARCKAASEMMSVIYALQKDHAQNRRCVVEAISIEVIPRSIPTEFFDVHSDWIFALPSIPTVNDGTLLDRAAQRIALETPEFRNQFLALARTQPDEAKRLLPSLFADFRRGLIVVDRRFQIKHCSPRAADLLRRDSRDLIDRPLATLVDGVDLVTIKRECARVASGVQSPFVVSWRIAPGHYEPREVTADAITSEHRPVGYLIAIGAVESTRGPRAVYRQLAEERDTNEPSALPAGEEQELDDDEALNESLQGTQVTRREHEVLLLILGKQSNRAIARRLSIAEVTVKKHLTSIYRKLRITNRAELVQSFASPQIDGSKPGTSE